MDRRTFLGQTLAGAAGLIAVPNILDGSEMQPSRSVLNQNLEFLRQIKGEVSKAIERGSKLRQESTTISEQGPVCSDVDAFIKEECTLNVHDDSVWFEAAGRPHYHDVRQLEKTYNPNHLPGNCKYTVSGTPFNIGVFIDIARFPDPARKIIKHIIDVEDKIYDAFMNHDEIKPFKHHHIAIVIARPLSILGCWSGPINNFYDTVFAQYDASFVIGCMN